MRRREAGGVRRLQRAIDMAANSPQSIVMPMAVTAGSRR